MSLKICDLVLVIIVSVTVVIVTVVIVTVVIVTVVIVTVVIESLFIANQGLFRMGAMLQYYNIFTYILYYIELHLHQ